MTTGMRHEDLFVTSLALRLDSGAEGAAAVFDGGQSKAVAGKQRRPIVAQHIGFKGFNDRGQPDHFTPHQVMAKPLIKVLMRAVALVSVSVVRWV